MNTSKFRITGLQIFGLEESILASQLPMMDEFDGNFFYDKSIIEKALKGRCTKLGTAPSGSGHDNFLKGIVVQFNLRYPVYFSPQLQRYNWIDIVSSQSTMHRITKFDLMEQFDGWVSKRTLEYIEKLINFYNEMEPNKVYVGVQDSYSELIGVRPLPEEMVENWATYLTGDEDGDIVSNIPITKPELFERIVANLPQGQYKWMRITTNFSQLKTIYNQRKNHKLTEWKEFARVIESIPEFRQMVLGQE